MEWNTLLRIHSLQTLWKCTGYQVAKKEINGKIRFPDGTVIENRGDDGKLVDLFEKFKPDKASNNTKYS